MGIPLAALGVRPPQQQNPMAQMGQMVRLKSLLQQQQANKGRLEAQKKQRDQQDEINKIISRHKGDWRKALPEIRSVSLEYAQALETQGLELSKLRSEEKIKTLEMLGAQRKRWLSLASDIKNASSYESTITKAVEEGSLKAQEAQSLLSRGYDPEEVEAWTRDTASEAQMLAHELKVSKFELEEPGVLADIEAKHRKTIADTMGSSKSTGDWRRRLRWLPRGKNKVPQEMIDALVPEDYSPENAAAMRELAYGPIKPEKPDRSATRLTLHQKIELRNRRDDRLQKLREKYRFEPTLNAYVTREGARIIKVPSEQYNALEQQVEEDYRNKLRMAGIKVPEEENQKSATVESAPSGPRVGERRKYQGNTYEFNGREWTRTD